MTDVTLMVIVSEDGRQTRELTTIQLPGVPRVGDLVIAENAEFEVRAVVWSEGYVSLHVYSLKYGIGFPIPGR